MTRARSGRAFATHDTLAQLLKKVEYGEADLVVTLFTERLGRVSALARGARKSRKRFGGALEPLQTLRVTLDEREGADLALLREATIATPRLHLSADLARIEASGIALSWVRRAAPHSKQEPEVWRELERLLDGLNDRSDERPPRVLLAQSGLALLAAFGWGLELERCVRCAKACEKGRAAMIDPTRGGLVCRSCGGAARRLPGEVRERLTRAAAGEKSALSRADAETGLALIDAALRAHAGLT